MESLIKQTRARFGNTPQENKQESSSTGDRKVPPQKTQSFREKKKSQSWMRRQLSRQMSWDYNYSAADYPTAVAAAAYAVQSLEESNSRDQKETTYGPDKSLNKMKSKVEDTGILPEHRKSAVKFTGETSKTSFKDSDIKVPISTSTMSKKMPEKAVGTIPSIKKKTSSADIDLSYETTSHKPENPAVEKAPGHTPLMKRPPTFADTHLNITSDSKKPETRRQSATKPGPGDSMADAWEKEEMASIKERYEKLRDTIEDWETKKNKKAKRKIERIEAEMDKRRAKAVQSYRNEITRIKEIAGGARAQAENNRRNEEIKVKEKANKIRSTGKLPATCLCF